MQQNSYEIFDKEFNFYSYFDPNNGNYLRSNVCDENKNDTGIEPFMAEFPHLLDIGIMGHCVHGLSNLCKKANIDCYQSGATINKPNMSLNDFKSIVDRCKGKVMQFALGGRGDPDMHENFEEILDYSRQANIIPNITTSGYSLTKEKAKIISKYCGAAAVSFYRNEYTYKAIELLLEQGVTTNIHFVLEKNSIDEATQIVSKMSFPKGISRIVFLLYKPVGQGKKENLLKIDDKRINEFFSLFNNKEISKFIGYDSCSVPAVVNLCKNIDPQSYDACEGARFSAYISSDMYLTPCSFDQDLKFASSLKNKTIKEIWDGEKFNEFRNILKNSCPKCQKQINCMGGCPLIPEIVLCEDKRRFHCEV